MEDQSNPETTERLPVQAEPVIRTVVDSALSGDGGLEPCDNEHTYFLYGLGFGRGKTIIRN